jgi:hypothetical protein
MTREQIIKNLEYLIQFLPGKSIYAEKTLTCAIAALRGPVPDPETGLVPCGCGGKAGFHYSVMMRDNDCYVECGICGGHTKVVLSEDKARDAWNTAMGYKEDA